MSRSHTEAAVFESALEAGRNADENGFNQALKNETELRVRSVSSNAYPINRVSQYLLLTVCGKMHAYWPFPIFPLIIYGRLEEYKAVIGRLYSYEHAIQGAAEKGQISFLNKVVILAKKNLPDQSNTLHWALQINSFLKSLLVGVLAGKQLQTPDMALRFIASLDDDYLRLMVVTRLQDKIRDFSLAELFPKAEQIHEIMTQSKCNFSEAFDQLKEKESKPENKAYSKNKFRLFSVARSYSATQPRLSEIEQALSEKQGIAFFHEHDDLDSFCYLIKAMPYLAENKIRPVKHFYLEFPHEYQGLIDMFYKTGDESIFQNIFSTALMMAPETKDAYIQLFKAARENAIQILAIDNASTSILRFITMTSENISVSAAGSVMELAELSMVKKIKSLQSSTQLPANQGYLILCGLQHHAVAVMTNSCSWAFLPSNYLKDDIEISEVNPHKVADMISLHHSISLMNTFQKFLPICDKIIVTSPVNISAQQAHATTLQQPIEPVLERKIEP